MGKELPKLEWLRLNLQLDADTLGKLQKVKMLMGCSKKNLVGKMIKYCIEHLDETEFKSIIMKSIKHDIQELSTLGVKPSE